MKILIKYFSGIVFLLFANQLHSQTIKSCEVFLFVRPIILSEKTLTDTIILFEDSTFKYSGHYYDLGIESEFSEGTYSKNDSCIVLNSFKKYKRDFNVFERRRVVRGTKYKQKRGNYPNYHDPKIYEFNNINQKIKDTLVFPLYKYEVDSYNNDAIGFILYDYNEYVGEYVFKIKNNRMIIIEIGPRNYSFYYFKDEKFIVKGDTIVREKNNRIYTKQ